MLNKNFTPKIACHMLKDEQAQLVDVRSQLEFAEGALPDAINLPLQSIMAADNFLDRKKVVILYCTSGRRSNIAKSYLLQMGYRNVYDLGSYQNYRC